MRMGLSLTAPLGSALMNVWISALLTSVAGSGGVWATVESARSRTIAARVILIIGSSFLRTVYQPSGNSQTVRAGAWRRIESCGYKNQLTADLCAIHPAKNSAAYDRRRPDSTLIHPGRPLHRNRLSTS